MDAYHFLQEIEGPYMRFMKNILFPIIICIALLAFYVIIRGLYKIYVFFTTVYEYKPDHLHLRDYNKNKLYGRVNKKTGLKDEPPAAVPNGWYYIMNGHDLQKEEVKHVQMCGLDLAVFRDSDGHVHALDAYCPHLGANMAIGGKVKGKCLECPFHAWKYDGEDGKCTDIPGAKKIPEVARVKSWPVIERNLVIMLWYDSEDSEPTWLPREYDEIYHQGWVLHARGEHIVNAHISEIPENGADLAHFNPVHQANLIYGSSLVDINLKKNRSTLGDHLWSEAYWKASDDEWYIARGALRHDITVCGKAVPFSDAHTVFEQAGPGMVYLMSRIPAIADIMLIMFVTPLEMFKQRVVHVAIGPPGLYGKLCSVAGLRIEACMVERDAVIWNHKVSRQQSILTSTQADEQIVRFRRWFAQFYSDNSKKPLNKVPDLSW